MNEVGHNIFKSDWFANLMMVKKELEEKIDELDTRVKILELDTSEELDRIYKQGDKEIKDNNNKRFNDDFMNKDEN